ncbi:MAG: MerR family transcriptional regulator [Chloroflexota bacterium]
MFKIGEFSRISRVPAKTLRYYDEIGLFTPARVDASNGYRLYSADQLPRLNRILVLKEMGLSLTEISRLLDESLSPEELRGMFRLKEAELRQQVEEAQNRLQQVANRLTQIEREGQMPDYDVVLKTIEPQRVMSIRQIAPKPEDVGNFLGECAMALYAAGITPTNQPFTIFYDADLTETDMDIETAIPVDSSVDATLNLDDGRQVVAHTLPGLESATCVVHQGSYDNFEQPYAVLGRWIEANGYVIAGPPREIYLTAPEEGKEPITEIQYPVAKA